MSNMQELSIEKFDPTVEYVSSVVEGARKVVVTDINDKSQIELVHEHRIALRDLRVAINKKGKELREDALKFQKAVIAKEKDLIAIIEPEEARLKDVEDQVKIKKIRQERLAVLPERKAKLAEIEPEGTHDDEALLAMDTSEFQGYVNQKLEARNRAKQDELDRKERELKERELEIQREKEMREREDKVRQEERERADQREKDRTAREEQDRKDRAEREARDKKEAEERAVREKAEAERKQKEIEEGERRNKKLQAFLLKHGVSELDGNWKRERVGNTIRIYKLVAEINLDE